MSEEENEEEEVDDALERRTAITSRIGGVSALDAFVAPILSTMTKTAFAVERTLMNPIVDPTVDEPIEDEYANELEANRQRRIKEQNTNIELDEIRNNYIRSNSKWYQKAAGWAGELVSDAPFFAPILGGVGAISARIAPAATKWISGTLGNTAARYLGSAVRAGTEVAAFSAASGEINKEVFEIPVENIGTNALCSGLYGAAFGAGVSAVKSIFGNSRISPLLEETNKQVCYPEQDFKINALEDGRFEIAPVTSEVALREGAKPKFGNQAVDPESRLGKFLTRWGGVLGPRQAAQGSRLKR
jgi:hypothetical protein